MRTISDFVGTLESYFEENSTEEDIMVRIILAKWKTEAIISYR